MLIMVSLNNAKKRFEYIGEVIKYKELNNGLIDVTKYRSQPEGHRVTGGIVQAHFTKELYKNTEILTDFNKNKKVVLSAINLPEIQIDMNVVKAASDSYKISVQ